MAPRFAGCALGAGRHPSPKDLFRPQRRFGKSALLALLGERKRQGTDSWSGEHDLPKFGLARERRGDDQGYRPRFVGQPLLVYPWRRSAHGPVYRLNPRRRMVHREWKNSACGAQLSVQSKLARVARPRKCRNDWGG